MIESFKESFTAAGYPLLAFDSAAGEWKMVIGWTAHDSKIAPVVVSEGACVPVLLFGPTAYVRPMT